MDSDGLCLKPPTAIAIKTKEMLHANISMDENEVCTVCVKHLNTFYVGIPSSFLERWHHLKQQISNIQTNLSIAGISF